MYVIRDKFAFSNEMFFSQNKKAMCNSSKDTYKNVLKMLGAYSDCLKSNLINCNKKG
jgi:hypothetical protein